MSTEIVKKSTSEISFTSEQIEIIKKTIAKDATPLEFELFMNIAKSAGLNPFHRQVFFVRRGGIGQTTASIDGLRLIAHRTGEYRGQVGPLWCGEDGKWQDVWTSATPPVAAKVGVWRVGFSEPLYSVANFQAYCANTPIWKKMPELMISKCFDEDTEVLTENGFCKFSEVKRNTKIAQVTETGLEFVNAVPFKQDYYGEMVAFFSDDLNFCVTPNHNMITTAGNIEAGTMFELSRARPSFHIPRIPPETITDDLPMTDEQIELAAAYMCDGDNLGTSSFRVKVSREMKIDKLLSFDLAKSQKVIVCVGKQAVAPSGRIITTRADQQCFTFNFSDISALCTTGKRLIHSAMLAMNSRQAKIFVDAWAFFDGNARSGGGESRTLRIFTSDTNHADIVELLAIKAGYAVSRQYRNTEFKRKQIIIALSERDEVSVSRWGRYYKFNRESNRPKRTLEIVENKSGVVWCVTVPSGVIVVRREGFSMLCGNCAESLALRRAFPLEMSGLYSNEELEHDLNGDAIPATVSQAQIEDAPAIYKGNDSDKKWLIAELATFGIKNDKSEEYAKCAGDWHKWALNKSYDDILKKLKEDLGG